MKVEYVWNFPSRIRDVEVASRPSDLGWASSDEQSKEVESTSRESSQVS